MTTKLSNVSVPILEVDGISRTYTVNDDVIVLLLDYIPALIEEQFSNYRNIARF